METGETLGGVKTTVSGSDERRKTKFKNLYRCQPQTELQDKVDNTEHLDTSGGNIYKQLTVTGLQGYVSYIL